MSKQQRGRHTNDYESKKFQERYAERRRRIQFDSRGLEGHR
jgi:hypothetical protein